MITDITITSLQTIQWEFQDPKMEVPTIYNGLCKRISPQNMAIMTTTSSTAQGGGGSFKNRKPIGEACCCGAKMAERTH